MATAVPSRFAVLSIDDDDFKPKKTPKNTGQNKSVNQKNKGDKPKQQQHQPHQQQQKKDDKKKQNKSKKKKTSNNPTQQWEQWKQKDTMAVEVAFEQELHQAILLSKLTYEKQLVHPIKETNGKEQETVKKANKKTKKATMSLEEFNSLTANDKKTTNDSTPPDCEDDKLKEPDTEFFERVDKETKAELTKGKEKETLQARFNKIDDDITLAQLRVEVENRDKIIDELRIEVDTLKQEVSSVKERNKKLYQILSNGEMKDKASVLEEVARLQEIQEELTAEVASLHVQLEQERSKTRTSSTDVKSDKKKSSSKKKSTTDNV